MHTASSAKRTCRLSRSAVEYTATVLMPISRHVRITRNAISPRLAMSIFLNTSVSLDEKTIQLMQPLTNQVRQQTIPDRIQRAKHFPPSPLRLCPKLPIQFH